MSQKKKAEIRASGLTGLLLAGLTIMVGCDEPAANPIINYGSGVYYFPTEEFGHALSEFINKNPCLSPAAMTGDSAGRYGWDLGKFVYFRQICPPEK